MFIFKNRLVNFRAVHSRNGGRSKNLVGEQIVMEEWRFSFYQGQKRGFQKPPWYPWFHDPCTETWNWAWAFCDTGAFSKSPRFEQIHYLKDYKKFHVPVQKLKTKGNTPSNFQTKKIIFNLWKLLNKPLTTCFHQTSNTEFPIIIRSPNSKISP